MFNTGFPERWSTLRKLLCLRIMQGAAAVLETVTGNAPLTLANAVAKAIKSLTQTGLCAQASTPTPSAPVDIKCNNGKLMYGAVGKNLFDKSTADANRITAYFPSTGTTWAYTSTGFSIRIPCKPNTTYTARYNGNSTQAVLSFGSTNNDDVPLSFSEPVTVTQAIRQGNPTIDTPITLTTGASDKWLIVAYNVNNPQHSDMQNNLQIEKGATATAYEPYQAGIYADGTPEVLTVGSINLCNPAYYQGDGWYVGANNTVTSANANGTLVFPCKPNTTYSWWHTAGAGGCRAFELPTDTITVGQEASWAVGNPAYTDAMTVKKCTTSANAKLLCVLFGRDAEGVGRTISEQLSDFMLVEGDISTATAYEPYTAQTASAENLFAVGTYADTHEIIGGGVTRKCGVAVLTGEENISVSNACFTIPINDRVTSKTDLLCSHFPYSNKTSSQTEDCTIISFSSTNIGFRYDACADKTAFAAFLATQYAAGTPVIIIYPLIEETTESVAGQALHTVAGTNTVSVTAEVSPVALTCEYYQAAA